MSGPSQSALSKEHIWKPNNRYESASKSISDIVLDPVMVEEAWARIRSYLSKGVKFQDIDAFKHDDKENMHEGTTERGVDDGTAPKHGELVGGKAADDAWKFIHQNAARAVLGVRASTNIGPTATTTKEPHAESMCGSQQLSSDSGTERVSNNLPESTPFSNRLSFFNVYQISDRRFVERRRRFVERWIEEQQQRLQERLRIDENASQEIEDPAGVGSVHRRRPWGTVLTSGRGERSLLSRGVRKYNMQDKVKEKVGSWSIR